MFLFRSPHPHPSWGSWLPSDWNRSSHKWNFCFLFCCIQTITICWDRPWTCAWCFFILFEKKSDKENKEIQIRYFSTQTHNGFCLQLSVYGSLECQALQVWKSTDDAYKPALLWHKWVGWVFDKSDWTQDQREWNPGHNVSKTICGYW